jgi:hypothetical protein
MKDIRGNDIYVSDLDEFRSEMSAMFLNKVVLAHGIEIPVDIMQVLKSLTDEQIYHHDIQVSYWSHENEPESSIGNWNMRLWQMKAKNPEFTLSIKLDSPNEDGKDYEVYYLYLKPLSND